MRSQFKRLNFKLNKKVKVVKPNSEKISMLVLENFTDYVIKYKNLKKSKLTMVITLINYLLKKSIWN